MSPKPRFEFLDTNVLFYALDNSAGAKHERAEVLLTELWLSRQGCVSIQVLQELYVSCTRRLKGITPEDLHRIVEDLSRWRVFSPAARDVLAAIDLHKRYRVSFWDAMIVHSANRLGCAVLWTEELNAGQRIGNVEVKNPFAQ
jgi:predicted nucleic acid-binding protein